MLLDNRYKTTNHFEDSWREDGSFVFMFFRIKRQYRLGGPRITVEQARPSIHQAQGSCSTSFSRLISALIPVDSKKAWLAGTAQKTDVNSNEIK